MAKRYIDQLAEWAKKRDAAARPRRQDKNVVAFLAVRANVKEAMDAGYALKTIWEHMHEIGKIPYRYETFLKHVRRHIKQPPEPDVAPVTPPADPTAKKAAEAKTKKEPPSVSGFVFDATPKKEDLI